MDLYKLSLYLLLPGVLSFANSTPNAQKLNIPERENASTPLVKLLDDKNSFNDLIQKLRPLAKRLVLYDYHQETSFNIDSVNNLFKEDLLKLLEFPQSFTYNFRELPAIGTVIKSEDNKVRVIEWGYDSKETGGRLSHTVIQYKKKDGKHGTCLISQGKKSGFKGFYSLCSYLKPLDKKNNLYLVLGEGRINSSYGLYQALVFQVKDNSIFLEYTAFPNDQSLLTLKCYYDDRFNYSEENKTLTINLKECDTNNQIIQENGEIHSLFGVQNQETYQLKFADGRFGTANKK